MATDNTFSYHRGSMFLQTVGNSTNEKAPEKAPIVNIEVKVPKEKAKKPKQVLSPKKKNNIATSHKRNPYFPTSKNAPKGLGKYFSNRSSDSSNKFRDKDTKEQKEQTDLLKKIEKKKQGSSGGGGFSLGKAGLLGAGGLLGAKFIKKFLTRLGIPALIYGVATGYNDSLKKHMETQGLSVDDAQFTDKATAIVNTIGDGVMGVVSTVAKPILKALGIDYTVDPKMVSTFTATMTKKWDEAIGNFRANSGEFGNGVVDFLQYANIALGTALPTEEMKEQLIKIRENAGVFGNLLLDVLDFANKGLNASATIFDDMLNDMGRAFEKQSKLEQDYRKAQEGWGWFDSKKEKEEKEIKLREMASTLVKDKDYMDNASDIDKKTVIARANAYNANKKAKENSEYFAKNKDISEEVTKRKRHLKENKDEQVRILDRISKATDEEELKRLKKIKILFEQAEKNTTKMYNDLIKLRDALGDVPHDNINSGDYTSPTSSHDTSHNSNGTLLEVISEGEGTSEIASRANGYKTGYDVTLANGKHLGGEKPELSKMTIDEVRLLQKRMKQDPSNRYKAGKDSNGNARYLPSAAVGKYQMIEGTLQSAMKKAGLNGSDLFSPKNQDLMANELLKGRGLNKYKNGEINFTKFMKGASQEWASLEGNTSGQRIATSSADIKSAIKRQKTAPRVATASKMKLKQMERIDTEDAVNNMGIDNYLKDGYGDKKTREYAKQYSQAVIEGSEAVALLRKIVTSNEITAKNTVPKDAKKNIVFHNNSIGAPINTGTGLGT